MRTFTIVIAIVVVISSLITFEKVYINKFCSETEYEVVKLKKSINNNEFTTNLISEVISNWHKRKQIMFAIANHNIFKDIEVNLFNLEYAIKNNNKQSALYYADYIHNSINELKELTLFDLSNILQVQNKILKY